MTVHEWTDVTVRINGVECPGAHVTADMGDGLDSSGLTAWPTTDGTMVMPTVFYEAIYGSFRRPYRYERLKWRRAFPKSHDAIGRLSLAAMGENGRAFIGQYGPLGWTAQVERGAVGAITQFSRRCDAKRWCEVQLAKWSCA